MPRFLSVLACCLALGVFVTTPTYAQLGGVDCSGEPNLVQWPEPQRLGQTPLWEFTWIRPRYSSGTSGSGIEIRDVKYRGKSVLKRGHAPIVNVDYDEPCGCYRDWSDSEVRFQADGAGAQAGSCATNATPGTVQTVCEVGGQNGDIGDFEGVAFEDYGDELVLTSQYQAGWYRYTQRWHFFADGRIYPEANFAATSSYCPQYSHNHHMYFRLDFDIDGADGDYVVESNIQGEQTTIETEATRTWQAEGAGVEWTVFDEESGLGYRLTPSAADLRNPADAFSKWDVAVLRYKPFEIDDGGGSCDVNFQQASAPLLNSESVDGEDLVLWYRAGHFDEDGDDYGPDACSPGGPTLKPIGNWTGSAVDQEEAPAELPEAGFMLANPHPNPTGDKARVDFVVDRSQAIELVLYDAQGRALRTLYQGTPSQRTRHTVDIDLADLSSGVYSVQLIGEDFTTSRQLVLTR